MADAKADLRSQWANPADILSLLLLIGGDIVQKAIAQLVGRKIHVPSKPHLALRIAPVAFSFGWVAYAFSNLLAAVGVMQLMPQSDTPCILVNCSNGFTRDTRSWALGRLLRDHEIRCRNQRHTNETSKESIRIDIFDLKARAQPTTDLTWWSGWVIIVTQIVTAIIPWVLEGDWGPMSVAMYGNLLAAFTCAMPQWTDEKWAARVLKKRKVTCLTRGNGYQHIMVFIGDHGSWDFESLAPGYVTPRFGTRLLSLIAAILWTCLLIYTAALQHNTWYLIGIGGIGMLQNVFAAGVPREPEASGFHISHFSRVQTIVGRRGTYQDDVTPSFDADQVENELCEMKAWTGSRVDSGISQSEPSNPHRRPSWLTSMSREDGVPSWLEPIASQPVEEKMVRQHPSQSSSSCESSNRVVYSGHGVHGALMELEKWVPTAGISMLQIFFPAGLAYNDASIRDNVHKKFWRKAYQTARLRAKAEERRVEEESCCNVS